MTLIWTVQAATRLQHELEGLASVNASAADVFARRVQEAVGVLKQFAYAGSMTSLGLRKYVVPKTRLILLYAVVENTIEITACYDGRENWRTYDLSGS